MSEADLPINEQINVWRADVVKEDEMLSQAEALAGADKTFEGYFEVPLVVDKQDYE